MRWATLLALACSIAGCYVGLKLARAERYAETATPDRLILSDPGNAAGWSRLGRPAKALARNAYRGADWIAWAAEEELHGDAARAEWLLRQAFEHDRTFKTRWALANFYLRQNRTEECWLWLGRAAEFSYGDPGALFNLAERLDRRPEVVLGRALKKSPGLALPYLNYLTGAGRLEEALPVAVAAAGTGPPEASRALLDYANNLLVNGRGGPAEAVWNALSRTRRIGFAELQSGALRNTEFRDQPLNAGFDWIVHPRPGHVEGARTAEGWRIAFLDMGGQRGDLLSQFFLCEPGRAYEVEIVEERDGVPRAAALDWTVRTYPDRSSLGKADAGGRLRFRAPTEGGVLRLALASEPAPGATRPQGSLTVRRVTLRESGNTP